MREQLIKLFEENASAVQVNKAVFDNTCKQLFINELEKLIETKEKEAFEGAREVNPRYNSDYLYTNYEDWLKYGK